MSTLLLHMLISWRKVDEEEHPQVVQLTPEHKEKNTSSDRAVKSLWEKYETNLSCAKDQYTALLEATQVAKDAQDKLATRSGLPTLESRCKSINSQYKVLFNWSSRWMTCTKQQDILSRSQAQDAPRRTSFLCEPLSILC